MRLRQIIENFEEQDPDFWKSEEMKDPPIELTVTLGMRDVTDIEGRTVLRLRKSPESYESWEAMVAEVERALGVAYEVDPADLDDADYEATLLRVDRHDHLFESEAKTSQKTPTYPCATNKIKMRLHTITERHIRVTGGANSNDPDYQWPWSHPHEERNAPDRWYHGTTDRFLDDILANGIDPAKGKNGKTHLTLQKKLAQFAAARSVSRWGGNPIILVLSVTDLPGDLIGSDADSSYNQPIPPKSIIKVLPGKNGTDNPIETL